ncbi:hypothetical protein TL16_g03063 [Triparma laevis f. inornata]|uniref:rRNA methyltransferase 1, mitochondrial n=1 Tax=Triparma laevis f. inornata TaxID=1714386 RepID=A0A9W7A345_9STRA|nr:hypothetical protein TL16_g03063 [Triparma laevis f. inornata]
MKTTSARSWGEKDDDTPSPPPPSPSDSDEFSFSRPRKSSSSPPKRSTDNEGRKYRSGGRGPPSEDRRGPPRGDRNFNDRQGPPRGDRNFNDRRGPPRSNNRDSSNNSNNSNNRNFPSKENEGPRINLRHLESLGFEHLFGLSPVLNALKSGRRFTDPSSISLDLDSYESDKVRPEKILFIQEKFGTSGRSDYKERLKDQIIELASSQNIKISTLDKGTLNSLSSNRPHQGFVLRCPPLLLPSTKSSEIFKSPSDPTSPKLWLALDSVLDPVNLGSIIRTSSFLSNDIGVLTCLKNSAPLSPIVSSTSAGAMENAEIVVCNNMVECLNEAKDKGWRILIADAYKPETKYDTRLLKEWEPNIPTVLVLGSEGDGVRSVVKKCCDGVVSVEGGGEEVDSLNVSVSAGILIHYFMR